MDYIIPSWVTFNTNEMISVELKHLAINPKHHYK